MSSQSGKRAAMPRTVVALGLTSLFADVGSEMIFPLLPVLLVSLGAAPAFIGLIEGVADAVASILKYLSGVYADRIHKKKPFVIAGYSIAAITRPLLAFALFPWHVLALRTLDRIGKGIRTAPRDALIADAAAEGEAGRAFGFHRAMDHAGAIVGPLLGTLLVSFGWPIRRVIMFAVVPCALSVAAVFLVKEAPRAIEPKAATQLTSEPLPPKLTRFFLILFLFALGNSSDAFLLLRAKEIGVSNAALPLLWVTLNISKLVTTYFGGQLSDRIPRTHLIFAGWFVYALSYAGLGFASAPWHAWALFVGYGAFFGLTEPVEKAFVKDLAPANARGRAFGVYNFVVGASSLPASLLAGYLWQTWSSRVALLTGSALAVVSAILLFAWTIQHPRDTSKDTSQSG